MRDSATQRFRTSKAWKNVSKGAMDFILRLLQAEETGRVIHCGSL